MQITPTMASMQDAFLPKATAQPYSNRATADKALNPPYFSDVYAIALAFDVTDMSISDRAAMSTQLYNLSEISFQQHAMLSFDPNRIEGATSFVTEPNARGNYNMIKEYEARMERDRRIGNARSMEIHKQLLNIFQRMHAASGGGVNLLI